MAAQVMNEWLSLSKFPYWNSMIAVDLLSNAVNLFTPMTKHCVNNTNAYIKHVWREIALVLLLSAVDLFTPMTIHDINSPSAYVKHL